MYESIRNKTEKYRWLFVFLLTIPFFNDAYSGFQIISDWTMDELKIFVFVLLTILTIIKNKRFSPLLIALFASEGWWLVTTIINYSFGDQMMYHKLMCDIVNALSMGLIVEYFKDDPKNLVSGLMLNLELSVYPNFINVLMTTERVGNYFLLGYYSLLILWMMPAICVSILYMFLHKKYIRGSLLLIVSITTLILVKCATQLVALLGMLGIIALGLVLYKMTKQNKVLLSVFTVLAILLNVFVLFIYNGGQFPLIDFFIEKILHKTTTFTDRVPVWQEAIRMIKEKPIIGHGFRPSVYTPWHDGVHAHNYLLQILNARGIIGLVLFAIFHVVLCIKVDKSKNTLPRLILVGACFGLFLTYITEAYKKFFRFYLVFFLAYHIDELIRDRINNKDYLFK